VYYPVSFAIGITFDIGVDVVYVAVVVVGVTSQRASKRLKSSLLVFAMLRS